MSMKAVRLFAVAVAASVVALGHYTWVAPVSKLETGKAAVVRISHGHKFPESEEAINARQVDLFALAPSGTRVKLQPVADAGSVTAPFTPAESGTYRIAFAQDRGVSSRTPKGVKKGGRDVNPDAQQSSRTFRTAMVYAATGGAAPGAGKPAGLEIELTAERKGGAWSVQLLERGKPASGIAVEAFPAGAAHASEIGKTDGSGVVRYTPSAGVNGPVMFAVAYKSPAPAGSKYDFVNYESSLYVSW